jgi:hypothetical protein
MSAVEEGALRGGRAAGTATDVGARSYGIERVFPIYTIAFAVIYFWGIYTGVCWLRYYPAAGQWSIGLTPLPASANAGPEMMWYCWMVNALFGGAVVAALSLLLPKDQLARLSQRWVAVPVYLTLILMVAVTTLLSGYFVG